MHKLVDALEPLIGQPLTSARFLLFDPSDDSGPPMREAVELRLGQLTLVVRALTNTSELAVSSDSLVPPDDADYQIVNAIGHERIAPFIGKHVRNWWSLTNDQRYSDGIMIAFSPREVLLFIGMNNEVSLLTVGGELCS